MFSPHATGERQLNHVILGFFPPRSSSHGALARADFFSRCGHKHISRVAFTTLITSAISCSSPVLLSFILEVTGSMFSCEQSGKQSSGSISSRGPASPHTLKLPVCLLADWSRGSVESVPATNDGVSVSVSRLHTSPLCFPTFTVKHTSSLGWMQGAGGPTQHHPGSIRWLL